MASPSNRRATNRRRSSITELASHGIHTSRPQKAKSVTHVSGTKCHLCLGPLIPRAPLLIFGALGRKRTSPEDNFIDDELERPEVFFVVIALRQSSKFREQRRERSFLTFNAQTKARLFSARFANT